MKSERFLEEIRTVEGLDRAVLKKLTVAGNEVTFSLVTDLTYTQDAVRKASEIASRYVPAGMTAAVGVVKSVPSEEGVKKAILEILKARFPAFAAFVSPADIVIEKDACGGRFFIGVGDVEEKGSDGVVDAVAAALKRNFCGNWLGELRHTEKRVEMSEGEIPPEERMLLPRFFEVTDYAALDGAAPKRAIYIADLMTELTDVTVCGTLTHIEERQTKNGKAYFSFAVSDGTGVLRANYFARKATMERIRSSVREGMSVCLTGENEIFNGGLSFRVKALDFGAPPQDFVPVARPSRPCPARYRCVFPVPETNLVQDDFFGKKPLPEAFLRGRFVVFDLETTGLGLGGAMDRIIEIGAVKVEGGEIRERFSSFVACPVKLSDEIMGLTGITDEMLLGAPDIKDVIADFYKFADGCALVAHNAAFDCRFIRYYGEKEGYLFEQKQYDTLAMAQRILRLKNYKLDTVAANYGFEFRHHRAFEDAFVTAKIFIELVREGGL